MLKPNWRLLVLTPLLATPFLANAAQTHEPFDVVHPLHFDRAVRLSHRKRLDGILEHRHIKPARRAQMVGVLGDQHAITTGKRRVGNPK